MKKLLLICVVSACGINPGPPAKNDAGMLLDLSTGGPGRIVIEYAVAGGAKHAVSLFDTSLNARCSVLNTVSGLRCLPADAQLGLYYSDSSCMRPVAVVASLCATVPRYAILANKDCTNSLYNLGSEVTFASYYAAPGCSPVAAIPSFRYYQVGTEVDTSTLPVAEFEH